MIRRCSLLLCSMTMLFAAETRRSDLFQSGTGGYWCSAAFRALW